MRRHGKSRFLRALLGARPVEVTIEIGLFLASDDVPVVTGEPVLKLLNYFVEIVEDVLSRLDAEARRIGIFA